MNHTWIYVHWITATKGRRKCISPEHDEMIRLEAAKVAKQHDAKLVAHGCGPDHAHSVVRISPLTVPASLVGQTKHRTSLAMKEAGVDNFRWQTGYWMVSVGQGGLERVVAYVENQRQRHGAAGIKLDDELERLGVGR